LKNYRFIGEEMESLGRRLDAARKSLQQSKTAWSRWFWQETLNRLLIQWRALPVLQDAQSQNTLIPKWTVNYDFWENNKEIGGWDITDKIFEKIYRADLNQSWEHIRTERIMRCSCQ
jgi:hypothetical protein